MSPTLVSPYLSLPHCFPVANLGLQDGVQEVQRHRLHIARRVRQHAGVELAARVRRQRPLHVAAGDAQRRLVEQVAHIQGLQAGADAGEQVQPAGAHDVRDVRAALRPLLLLIILLR